MVKQVRPRRGPALWGAFVALVLVVGGYTALAVVHGDGSTSAHAAAPVASGASCTWTPNTDAQTAADTKQTGTPASKGLPDSGTRDMVMTTNQGVITITLDVTKAPCSAASFTFLASLHYFDGTICHRLVTTGIYVLQCGDPSGKGDGGPSYTYASENLPTVTDDNYPTGIVAMANPSDPNLNGSQFFIVYKDTPTGALPNDYTVIGKVTGGMAVVQKVAAGGLDPKDPNKALPKLPVNISSVTVGPVTAG